MMFRRNTPPPPKPEHGDWRLPPEKPEEAEHLPPKPLGMMRSVKMRVSSLQAALPVERCVPMDDDPPVSPIHGWVRALRLLLAWTVLLPLSVLMVYALLLHLYHHGGATMGHRSFWLSEPVWYSLLGAGTFIALVISRISLPILVYVYVFGHELTHAITTLLCFGKVRSLRVNLDGGYVETDKDNVFIALSPYFVPLWMCCWLLVLGVFQWLHPFPQWQAWFCAGFGFWWSFHIYWTLWVIPREQPDMLENGVLFSLLLVLVMNIAILLFVLYLFGVLSPIGYAHDFSVAAANTWSFLRDLYAYLVHLARSSELF